MAKWLVVENGVVKEVIEKRADSIIYDERGEFKVGDEYSSTKFNKRYGLRESTAFPENKFPKANAVKANVKTYGNVWVREIKFERVGDTKHGHKHQFDHLHFLADGSVRIRIFDTIDREKVILEKDYTAPAWIKVPKEHFHDMESISGESLGYCIQSLRNENEDLFETNYAYDKDFMDEVKAYEKENKEN